MFIFSGTLFQISYVCFEHYHNVHQNISRIICQDLITEFILVLEPSLGLVTLLVTRPFTTSLWCPIFRGFNLGIEQHLPFHWFGSAISEFCQFGAQVDWLIFFQFNLSVSHANLLVVKKIRKKITKEVILKLEELVHIQYVFFNSIFFW